MSTIWDAVRRRWWVIAALTLAGLLIGGAAAVVVKPTYEATAQLYVDPHYEGTLQASDQLLERTFVQAATTTRVLKAAAATLNTGDIDGLRNHIRSEALRGTTYVLIHATSTSPGFAAAEANAVARAVVADWQANAPRNTAQLETINAQISAHDDQIKALQDRIAQLNKEAAAAAALNQSTAAQAAAIAALNNQLNDLQLQRNGFVQKRLDIQNATAQAKDAVTLIETASPPTRPSGPSPGLYLPIGAAGGFVLGLLMAMLLERFDTRLFDTDALALASGTHLVIGVPRTGDADAAAAESVFVLVNSHLSARSGLRTLAATAASDSGSARSVAAHMASAASHQGVRVMLIHAATGGDGQPGPAGNGTGPRVATVANLPDLAEEISSATLARTYERIFVSLPNPVDEPMIFGLKGKVDGAILVATAGQTTFNQARAAANAMRQAGFEPLAAILLPRGGGGRFADIPEAAGQN